MDNFRKAIAVVLATITLAGGIMVAEAQPGRGRHGAHHAGRHHRPMARRPYNRPVPMGYRGGYIRHNEWRRGYRLPPGAWGGGVVINDWGRYRLSAPPYGYQWRYIDGNYVLAAVATGVISSIIIGSMVR